MITETWISPGNEDNPQLSFLPDGYKILHVPRPTRRGGGVAIIYRECLNMQSHHVTPAKSFEGIEVVMTLASCCLRLITLYRPPPSPKNGFSNKQFVTEFTDLVDSKITSAGKLIIAGDFNFHWDNPHNTATAQMKDVLYSANLIQHVTGPTHLNGHTLDWILSRESEDIVSKTVNSSFISDHCFIHCTLKLTKPPLPREMHTYRSYKSVEPAVLAAELEASSLLQNPPGDLDALIDQYNRTLSELIDKHAPLRKRVVTIRPVSLWYNQEIHAAKINRRKCEARWRKTGLTVHYEMYKEARNLVTGLICKAKTSLLSERVEECGKDQKALFRVVDEILGRKSELFLPAHTSLKDVLNQFSSYFSTKIKSIRQALDAGSPNAIVNQSSVLPLTDPIPQGHLTNLRKVSNEEVGKLVSKSPSKSCASDPLPTWLLKKLSEPLIPTITDIVNKSIELSIFPSALKDAKVMPLLKKPSLDRNVLKNYRPVSNLPFLSKILEKAVLSQLTEHMETYDLFCPIQSAYRANHSTETALIKIQNDILLDLDGGKGIILVLLDLSAAFDTIDHNILVSRLQSRIGVESPALTWFSSYLEDRYQTVFLKGESSDRSLLVYGVPQGSVMGPVDFIVYLRPTYDIAQKHGISMHQYADDTQLYLAFDFDKQEEAVAKMEACIQDIKIWMMQNKLKLNDDKTEVVIIAPARQTHKVSINMIKIGDLEVKAGTKAKNLGAIFDNTMCLHDHVNSIVKSCNFQLRLIGQARKYLTRDAAEKVLHAFISSRLDCGNSLIYGLPDYQIQRLQRIQNTAARILTRTKSWEHISPILRSLHWLPVMKRIEYKILILTYKCLCNQAPDYLQEMLEPYQPGRSLRSSDKLLLRVPKTRLRTCGDRSFTKAAPILWNSLPHHLHLCNTLESFKSGLKTHLFG
jgi:hypothetical protein